MSEKKVFVVIDMQQDFITGALKNWEGQLIVDNLAEEVAKRKLQGYHILFTMDTHNDNYLKTQEGKNLPVPHCIKGSDGWEIIPQLKRFVTKDNTFMKNSFSDVSFLSWIKEKICGEPDEIILAGVCTDICVISNAMVLKASFPETPIKVMGDLCAGVTSESHKIALEAMKPCQIEII